MSNKRPLENRPLLLPRFLNSKDTKKTCFYFHFIYNFLSLKKVESAQEKSFYSVPVYKNDNNNNNNCNNYNCLYSVYPVLF